jgi:hypothetical protein
VDLEATYNTIQDGLGPGMFGMVVIDRICVARQHAHTLRQCDSQENLLHLSLSARIARLMFSGFALLAKELVDVGLRRLWYDFGIRRASDLRVHHLRIWWRVVRHLGHDASGQTM